MALGIVVGSVSLPIAVAAQGPSPTSTVVSALCAMSLGLLYPYEWRRDRRAAAMFGFVIVATGLVIAVSVAVQMGASPVVVGAAVASFMSALGLGRVIWQEYRFEDRLPSWLDERFPDALAFEDDGVQWLVEAADTNPIRVHVFLQNNVDAVRCVSVRLKDESGFALRSGALSLPEVSAIELPPRARATLTVSCRWNSANTSGKARLYCFVRASGPPGPRNRRQRKTPGPKPIPTWLVLLGPLGGIFIWRRGGVFLTLVRPQLLRESSALLLAEARIHEEKI
jgi:hypothetical protein